jgi:excisionase family DNA binding protein
MARARQGHAAAETGQVMTVDQVADYLQLNRLTVYRYVREGKIPAARIGKLYRLFKADVDWFLEAQKAGQKGSAGRRVVPAQGPAPKAPTRARPQSPQEIYVGPTWRERTREREARIPTYPIEWTIRGLH